jgi:hypothetical protein
MADRMSSMNSIHLLVSTENRKNLGFNHSSRTFCVLGQTAIFVEHIIIGSNLPDGPII